MQMPDHQIRDAEFLHFHFIAIGFEALFQEVRGFFLGFRPGDARADCLGQVVDIFIHPFLVDARNHFLVKCRTAFPWSCLRCLLFEQPGRRCVETGRDEQRR